MRVVFERRRAEQQDVPPERRDWRNRAIPRLARMSGRTAQPVRFIHDEEIDTSCHRLPNQLGPPDQRLEGDHSAAMDVEGIEPGAEVARDISQTQRIKQREHVVILAPQLAQPLHGERLGRDDKTALDLLRVQEPVHDQCGLDRLTETDLVGKQPANRHARGRVLGDMQLVREEANPPAEERAEAARFTDREQMQDVEPRHEVFVRVDVAHRQSLEQRPVTPARLLRRRNECVARCRQPERCSRVWKRDDQDPSFDRGDVSGAEIRIEAVGQMVADGPDVHTLILPSYQMAAAVRSGSVPSAVQAMTQRQACAALRRRRL